MAYKILADSNLDWGQNWHYLQRYLRAHPEAKIEPGRPVDGRIVVGANLWLESFPTTLKTRALGCGIISNRRGTLRTAG